MASGSIEDTVARLLLWSKRAPKGLARVEFISEFARKQAVSVLRTELSKVNIPFHEIELPRHQDVSHVVNTLREQLSALTSGVVSINGFATAFPRDHSLTDALRIFNFQREDLARPPVCQIWWLPSIVGEQFTRVVPDLDSWFMVRLQLTEIIAAPHEERLLTTQFDHISTNIDDARKRSAELVSRFESALTAGTPADELRQSLAIPAVEALLEARAEKEAHELALTLAQKLVPAITPPITTQRVNFFISYTSHDRQWAEWIAWELENAGFTVKFQAWDFRPGANFVLEMQEAATSCERTIAVLSPHYFSSAFTSVEWAAAFAVDPTGSTNTLLPVRVAPCEPPGLFRSVVYIDLVGKDERTARDALLNGIKSERAKPTKPPPFPGQQVVKGKPEFPGIVFSERPWNVPYQRNPFFTGREQVLEKLHQAITAGKTTALAQAQAISGLGGIGKTQTAVEYAYRYRDEYAAVLWAKAETRETLTSDFVALAQVLELPQKDAQEQNVAVTAVKRWLENNHNWLLILDNAEELALAREFLPAAGKGHVLLTTRARNTGAVAERIEIEDMGPDEGALFLLRRAQIIAKDAPLTAATADERATAKAIATALGGLPLALDQAAAFIAETPSTLAEYRELYKREGAKLLAQRGDLPPDDHPSVPITFSLAFQKVEEKSQAAADLIRACAFLAPDAIPEEIFTKGGKHLGDHLQSVTSSTVDFLATIKEASRFSMLDRNPATQTLDIHRLVQRVVKETMDEATQRLWAERVVCAVNVAFPDVEFVNWPQCDRLLPHAQLCAELIDTWALELEAAARLLHQTASYLNDRARYAQAAPLYQRALAISEKILGPDHPTVATTLNNLARLYAIQGHYTEAEPLNQRALAIRKHVLGPDHPDVAQSLNNLAMLYMTQGYYAEVAPLLQRALAIREHALGPDHPAVATTLNNLAVFYDIQGDYGQAVPLHQRALAIREKVLEPDHPAVATSLNNLATRYHKQGDYRQAAPLYQRALAILEKTIPDHPNTATLLESYAVLLQKTNREAEAEKLEARAREIRAKNKT